LRRTAHHSVSRIILLMAARRVQTIVRFKDTANDLRLKKICDFFKLSGKKVVDTYVPRLLKAEQLFYYHPVFNPLSDTVEHFTTPSSNSVPGSAPEISALELSRLGADPCEVLSVARKDSSPGGRLQASADPADPPLTVTDVCRGYYSIKDHSSILPRYPWEVYQDGRLVTMPADGKTTGWYMRRTLMGALKEQQARNLYYNSSSGRNTGGLVSSSAPIISTFMLPRPQSVPNSHQTKLVPPRLPAKPTMVRAATQPARPVVTSGYFPSANARAAAAGIRKKSNVSQSLMRYAMLEIMAEQEEADSRRLAGEVPAVDDKDDVECDFYDLVEDPVSGARYLPQRERSSSEVLGVLANINEPAAEDEEQENVAPTVYDLVDSPPVVAPKKLSAQAGSAVFDSEMCVDLAGDSPLLRNGGPVSTPPVLAADRNPFRVGGTEQNAALVTPDQDSINNSTGGAASGNVRRMTLGSAPFVPIPRPALDAAFAKHATHPPSRVTPAPPSAPTLTGLHKRKVATERVALPRKKVNGRVQSGSLLVGSIKSYFSSSTPAK
jgi:hypothetical protein